MSTVQATTMQAITQRRYGSPEVLRLAKADRPVPGDDQVLVSVHAGGVNPADWHYMTGKPYLVRIGGGGFLRPKRSIPGLDLAGRIEAVGKNVTVLKPGDDVFGEVGGAYAEYAVARQDDVVLKPATITHAQAAAVPIAALTALQGLRDKGKLESGDKVLVNGASGGVGTFAVQIAKALGADVTGVCSTRNVAMVRSIGADHVVDYTQEDFTKSGDRYDVILDTVGSRPLVACKRLLVSDGIYVGVGGPKTSFLVLTRMLWMALLSLRGKQKLVSMLAKQSKQDLEVLRGWLESGDIVPVLDRCYELSETEAALRHIGEGHAQGKIVITLGD